MVVCQHFSAFEKSTTRASRWQKHERFLIYDIDDINDTDDDKDDYDEDYKRGDDDDDYDDGYNSEADDDDYESRGPCGKYKEWP